MDPAQAPLTAGDRPSGPPITKASDGVALSSPARTMAARSSVVKSRPPGSSAHARLPRTASAILAASSSNRCAAVTAFDWAFLMAVVGVALATLDLLFIVGVVDGVSLVPPV